MQFVEHFLKEGKSLKSLYLRGLQVNILGFPFRLSVKLEEIIKPEMKTSEWWISRSMLDLLFFLISRLNNACYPLVINLQIN